MNDTIQDQFYFLAFCLIKMTIQIHFRENHIFTLNYAI